MIHASPEQQPSGGNWAWLSAVIAGAASIVTAILHRLGRKPQPRKIPTQNAEEIFARLQEIEAQQSTANGSMSRAWASIESARRDISDIKRDMVSRDDLQGQFRTLERRIERMLENKA